MSRALDAFLGSSVGGFVRSPLCERESGRTVLERAGTSITAAHAGWLPFTAADRTNFPQLYLRAELRAEVVGPNPYVYESEATFPDFCQGNSFGWYAPGLESEGLEFEERVISGATYQGVWVLVAPSIVTPTNGEWDFVSNNPANTNTLHVSVTLSQPASDIASRDSMMRNLIGALPLPSTPATQHCYWLNGDNTVTRQMGAVPVGGQPIGFIGGGACAQWAAIDREGSYALIGLIITPGGGPQFSASTFRSARREYGIMKVSRSTTAPNCILDYIGVQELETNYDFVRPFLGADCGRYYTKLSCTNVLGNIQREMPAPEFNAGLLAPATFTGAYAGIAVARFNAITRLDANLGLINSPPAFIPGACCPA